MAHLGKTIPESDHDVPSVPTAVELVTVAVKHSGPIKFARIATLKALNRRRVQEFTDRKDPHGGSEAGARAMTVADTFRNSHRIVQSWPGPLRDCGFAKPSKALLYAGYFVPLFATSVLSRKADDILRLPSFCNVKKTAASIVAVTARFTTSASIQIPEPVAARLSWREAATS